tara:strand:+ start:32367 stop:32945 length:579 start_codon:yes stop_codon:yes gene_type:complete
MEKNNQQPNTSGKKLLKVVFFGPESTGKTTLSQDLAAHFNTTWAAEYMREYLQKKWDISKETCKKEDLIPIAQGQMKNEAFAEKYANKVVFYDTNLLQLKVYSEVYYNGYCPPKIEKEVTSRTYDIYFLLYIDIPWEADDLRDKPNDREAMFQVFEEALKIKNISFITLKGAYSKRLETAKTILENALKNPK